MRLGMHAASPAPLGAPGPLTGRPEPADARTEAPGSDGAPAPAAAPPPGPDAAHLPDATETSGSARIPESVDVAEQAEQPSRRSARLAPSAPGRHVAAPQGARHRADMSSRRRARLRRTLTWTAILTSGLVLGVGLLTRPAGRTVATVPAAATSQPSSAAPVAPAPATPSAGVTTATAPAQGEDQDVVPSSPASVTTKGSGTYTVLAVPGADTVKSGRVVRYTVETEGGLAADLTEYTSQVRSILTGSQGWQTKDGVRFVNVSPAGAKKEPIDFRVTLASPTSVDKLCAPLQTNGNVSCHQGRRVVINLKRWLLGAQAYGKDVATYRIYLINHEVGHALGHQHENCPRKGAKAPVMVQQTLGLEGCTAWPYPVKP